MTNYTFSFGDNLELSNPLTGVIWQNMRQRNDSQFPFRMGNYLMAMDTSLWVREHQSGIYMPRTSQASGAELAGSRTALNNNVGSELNPQTRSARRIKIRLIVPLHDNNGTPIASSLLKSFEMEVAAIAGGLTVLSEVSRGLFAMPSRLLCTDRNRLYEVSVNSEEDKERLRILLHRIGSSMEQDSVYFEVDRKTECYIETVEPQTTTEEELSQDDHLANGRSI